VQSLRISAQLMPPEILRSSDAAEPLLFALSRGVKRRRPVRTAGSGHSCTGKEARKDAIPVGPRCETITSSDNLLRVAGQFELSGNREFGIVLAGWVISILDHSEDSSRSRGGIRPPASTG
jgi:hypothetical protein